MTTVLASENPLLIGKGLPPFDRIETLHVVPAMTQLLTELEQRLSDLEVSVTPTWQGLVEPLTQLEEQLTWSWGVISHLMGVKNSPELREAYETIQPQVVQFINRLGQSQVLYQAFQSLQAGDSWST